MILNFIRIKREHRFFTFEGGHRKLCYYLKKEKGITCNHKRMYRLCKLAGILLPKKKRQVFHRKKAKDIDIIRPNQQWQFDIKYGHIQEENRFFFICIFIDVFDRDIVGYYIGLKCTGQDIAKTLKLAIESRQIQEEDRLVIRSDNGSQMTSKIFSDTVAKLPIEHEFIPVRTPDKNAFVESFNSLLEINVTAPVYFYSFAHAYRYTVDYINFYRNERIHGSLKMTPVEFSNQFKLENKVDFVA